MSPEGTTVPSYGVERKPGVRAERPLSGADRKRDLSPRSNRPDGRAGAVTSVVRALAILSSFDLAHAEIGVSQVAARLGLHKSTAHRLLRTLESEGFVSKTANARYVLGRKVFELGTLAYARDGFQGTVLEELGRLTDATGETAHLAVLDEGEVLYVEKVESQRALRTPSAVGHRQPAHCTALGKVLLADLGPDEFARLKSSRLERFTPATITNPDELLRVLREVQANGYAVDREETEEGLLCIAAPITAVSGDVCAAVSISGPASRLYSTVDAKAAIVQESCNVLSRRLRSNLDWLRSYRVDAQRTPNASVSSFAAFPNLKQRSDERLGDSAPFTPT